MKYIWNFLIGFCSSLFIITCTDFELNGHGFMPLVKYIGPALLFGCIFVEMTRNRERIEYLEKKIKELEK